MDFLVITPTVLAIISFLAFIGFASFVILPVAIPLMLLSLSCLALAGGAWYYNKLQDDKIITPITDMEGVDVVSEGEETSIIIDGETIDLPADEATILSAASNDTAVDDIVDEIIKDDPEIASFLSILGIGKSSDTVEGFGSVDVLPYCSRKSRLPLIFGQRTAPYC